MDDTPLEPTCYLCGALTHGRGLIGAVRGGYESKHLLDSVSYQFLVCELCLRTLFDKMKISPRVLDPYEGFIPYAQERQQYARSMWRESEHPLHRLLNGKCNAVEECTKTATLRVFYTGSLSNDCCCEDHRKWFGAMNAEFVPFDLLNTKADHEMHIGDTPKIVSAYLRTVCPRDQSMYFKYLTEHMSDLFGFDWRTHPHVAEWAAALWVPAGQDITPPAIRWNDFEQGRLYLCKRETLEAWTRRPDILDHSRSQLEQIERAAEV